MAEESFGSSEFSSSSSLITLQKSAGSLILTLHLQIRRMGGAGISERSRIFESQKISHPHLHLEFLKMKLDPDSKNFEKSSHFSTLEEEQVPSSSRMLIPSSDGGGSGCCFLRPSSKILDLRKIFLCSSLSYSELEEEDF